MGFFDQFRKKPAAPDPIDTTEPDGPGLQAPIPGAEIAQKFSRVTQMNVLATMLFGMTHFDESPIQQGLAQMFTFAVRQRLLDELDGTTRTPDQVLTDLRMQVDAPPSAFAAFSKLTAADFDESYKGLRIQYAKQGVDLEELVEALKSAQAIASYVSRTTNK